MSKKEEIFNQDEEQKQTDNIEEENKETEENKDQAAEEETSEDNEAKEEKEVEESETEKLQRQLAELNDKYLRLSAEFDNYRKRTLKERMELIKNAGQDILMELLPVKDNFERALKSTEESKDVKAIREGIELIYNGFCQFLEQNGVKEIDAMNQEFDTDVHEAVTKIPAPEKKLKGKVVDVIEKGYFINKKVMRYAKVVVGE